MFYIDNSIRKEKLKLTTMADVISSLQTQLKELDTKFAGNNVLNQLEQRTNLPKSYLVVGSTIFYLLLIFINVGGIGEILGNFAGFVVPAYYSILALKTTTTKDDTQLLTYWIVFSFLNVIEFWSKALLYIIPFYWFLKTIFLLYIALPQTGGATMIYNRFISPLTDKYILGPKKTDGVQQSVKEASRATGAATH